MKQEELKIAQKYGIEEKVNKLEKDLLSVNGVVEVDFDLNGFLDNMNQVIFLTKYNIPVGLENYFEVRNKLIEDVVEVASNNGLSRTGDRIEDYGEHFYFVMKTDEGWRTKMQIRDCIKIFKTLQTYTTYDLPCPRCGKICMKPFMLQNCLSRHEDVYICRECGDNEAAMDLRNETLPLEDWYAVKIWDANGTAYVKCEQEGKKPYYQLYPRSLVKVTLQDIDDIMVTALEGGLTGWCCKAVVVGEYLGKYASDQISRGGCLILHDSEEDARYTLTLDKFLTGLTKYLCENPDCVNEDGCVNPGEIDAEGADCIVQCALFGEVIYG